MIALEIYIKKFTQLNRAPGQVWSEITRNRAPHKPILLMAVFDLISRGVIVSPFIDVRGDLVELNELFNLYWRRIVPLGQNSSIAFPFSRLHNEPFWELIPPSEKEITPAIINNISTVSQLRTVAEGANIDEDLFYYLQQSKSSSLLREALLRSCFSEQAQSVLIDQAIINAEAFSYSLDLEQKSHSPVVMEPIELYKYKPAARDQGFRRVVVTTYDHRCAICGVRIITPEGHTVVDAAHVIPWSKTRNDDIRNGMALCKLCHWAFDKGMVGVSDKYDVLTSRQISLNPNVPGVLLTLAGRGIFPPADQSRWPAQQFLSEHRQTWRLS
jgi:putative restriction endonuclease